MDPATARIVGELKGEINGQGKEIAGIREQLSTIHGDMGEMRAVQNRIEQKLDRVIDSGPQVALKQPEPAADPATEALTSAGLFKSLLKSKNLPHIVYPIAILLGLLAYFSFSSGRPASDFVPGTSHRVSPFPGAE